ncbi:MAG TPA: hypothetical protein VIE37_00915 [Methylomirabilota bacterium]|jgi:hypothetical protein
MDERSERDQGGGETHVGKRKYEPPAMLSQEVFETTALACMKRPGQCSGMKKNS